jgi:hypothetical protein
VNAGPLIVRTMRATLLFVAATASVATSEAVSSSGPLAVMRTNFGMQARSEGTLVVTNACVFLEGEGGRTLLLWPADQTSWSAATREIQFRRSNGEVIKRADGQSVVLGGGSFSMTTDGPNGEKVTRQVDWVVEPDPSCTADERWLVSEVEE